MVVVPAGEFMMGSPEGKADRRDDEGLQHKVTIAKPFAVGKYEVTLAEWNACVNAGGCKHEGYSNISGDKAPVTFVSWDHITKEFLPWLSRKTGQTYRLLAEAEWSTRHAPARPRRSRRGSHRRPHHGQRGPGRPGRQLAPRPHRMAVMHDRADVVDERRRRQTKTAPATR